MKAMLVYSSFVTRVIVPDNATEEEIIQKAKGKTAQRVLNEFGENLEDIMEDIECPYDPEKDKI